MIVAHLSDLHLGRKAVADPHGAERLNSLRRAISTLSKLSPDVILIAGDTFDSPQVDPVVVQEAAKTLADSRNDQGEPIPVVVIPGNHDPSEAESLWTIFRGALAGAGDRVRLALTPEAIELCDGRLSIEAYPCETRYSAEAPWVKRLPAPKANGAVRIVLAHGTLVGGPVPEGESDAYPFSMEEVEGLGVDYVALGHFHNIYPAWPAGDEIERSVCYCGTHEPDQFAVEAGHALVVAIEPGCRPRLRRVRVGKRSWRVVEVAGALDLPRLEALQGEIKRSDDPGSFVVRLRIAGGARLEAEKWTKLEQIEKTLRALGTQVDRRGELQPPVDVAALDLDLLPSGAVQEALRSLRAEWTETQGEERERIAVALQIGWEKLQPYCLSADGKRTSTEDAS